MIYIFILFILISLTFTFDRRYGHDAARTHTAIACYVIMFLAFVLLAALRDVSIGADTQNYFRDYNERGLLSNISSIGVETESSRYQPFWIYLVAFIKEILKDFNWLLAIESLFLNIVVFRFLWKNSCYPFLCITIYFISVYIGLNFETLREGFAVAFCLIAYEQFKNKRYIIAILLWACGLQFHISAIIALLYPVCTHLKYSKAKLNVFLVFAGIILLIVPLFSQYTLRIALFLINFSSNLAERFSEYANTEYNPMLNAKYYIMFVLRQILLPFIALYLMKDRSTKYFGFIIPYVILCILGAFSPGFVRFGNYFVFFYIIFIADFGKYLTSKFTYRFRSIILFSYIALVLFVFEGSLLVNDLDGTPIYERYIPYKSIFD